MGCCFSHADSIETKTKELGGNHGNVAAGELNGIIDLMFADIRNVRRLVVDVTGREDLLCGRDL